MPLSEGATRARHARRLLQRVLDYAPDGTTIHPIVRIGRHAAEGIIEASAEQEADLIIFGWGGKRGRRPRRQRPDRLLADHRRGRPRLAVRHRGRQAARLASEIRRVLVPVRGGPHAELAHPLRRRDRPPPRRDRRRPPPRPARASRWPSGPRPSGRSPRSSSSTSRARGEAVLREAPNVRNAILREAEKADLVVMGASASARRRRRRDATCSGPCPRRSPPARSRRSSSSRPARRSSATTFDQLAAARRDPGRRRPGRRGGPRRPGPGRALVRRIELPPRRVRRPAPARARSRRSRALTISLVLPTLDEEETIGPIVRRAMREMVGRVPLLDEVLVIDSASTDRTREIAEAEGARVVQHPDVLARYGSFRGKGEALWKSLYETTGDIIVWADTDVKNWHHRMVYGTLGPLLHEPRLQYVKGYYQRPIVEGGVLKEGGGGRVTELVARPLINLFYPELSGMIQPLAGRVRRAADAARGDPVLHRLRGRDRAPHRRRRAARHRGPRARSTWSGGSTATRSSRACRGCRSSSSRRS